VHHMVGIDGPLGSEIEDVDAEDESSFSDGKKHRCASTKDGSACPPDQRPTN
jgi:hypothetical protein